MKQKIVIKVSMIGQRSCYESLKSAFGFSRTDPRSKALQIAVSLRGIEHAGLVGTEKDHIEVTGDGIDAVQLTKLLRKRVGFADLVTVTPVGAKEKEKNKEKPILVPQYQIFEMTDYSQYRDPCACSIM